MVGLDSAGKTTVLYRLVKLERKKNYFSFHTQLTVPCPMLPSFLLTKVDEIKKTQKVHLDKAKIVLPPSLNQDVR
jgi:hypothetical protein